MPRVLGVPGKQGMQSQQAAGAGGEWACGTTSNPVPTTESSFMCKFKGHMKPFSGVTGEAWLHAPRQR